MQVYLVISHLPTAGKQEEISVWGEQSFPLSIYIPLNKQEVMANKTWQFSQRGSFRGQTEAWKGQRLKERNRKELIAKTWREERN